MKINGNPDGGGGKSAVIESLSVTSNGTYTAGGGVDGYSPVEVSVPEQKPEETFNVTPSTTEQTITPQEGYVFTSGVVGAVTSSIDANIQAGNIKSGVSILGVEGNYTAPAPVTESLSVSVNGTYNPGQGVDGFSQVIVDVPQSVTGYTEKDLTEKNYDVTNLNNSASFVAKNAFTNNTDIYTVNLPNCTVVSPSAFQNCVNLSSVSLPVCETIKQAGFNNTGLQTVYLPVCKSIEEGAFRYCQSLTDVNLPEVTDIDRAVFMDCSSLISVNIPKATSILASVFYSCRVLQTINAPDVEYISGGENFANCFSLQSLNFPKVSFISGINVFQNCWSLATISLPELLYMSTVLNGCSALTSIDLPKCSELNCDCGNCPNLTSVSIPNVINFYNMNFYSCSSLTSINVPNVAYLNTYLAFMSCENLSYINFPILSRAYYGFTLPSGSALKEINIGTELYFVPSYSNISNSYFLASGVIDVDATMYDKWVSANGWSSLSSLFSVFGDVNDPMLSFSDGLLYGKTGTIWSDYMSILSVSNRSVISINLPNCRVVQNYAFSGCRNLTTLSLPKCKCIYSQALNGCYSLMTIYFSDLYVFQIREINDGPWSMYITGSSVPLNTNRLYIRNSSAYVYVPASLVDAYKSAKNWSLISSHILPITE